ncbi:gibberellin-regulated family protein [Striga asiatica]|uniref:Gibberellin-regulated family protein n=1 Tax=Striga asiatica TaxID=4170 RepID=A0A5A7PDM5_STRAF|nr:gibberellin-regulated family protein [Striga asiatica]
MKLLLMLLIAILFIQIFVVAEVSSASDDITSYSLSQEDEGVNFGALLKKHHPRRINCRQACTRRCSKASRKKICHRACNTCCRRCNCVPPGTYGNKELCPCYASLRTHGNRPKCP